MTIIAFVIILFILVQIEVKVYQKKLFEAVEYTCEFSLKEIYEGEEFELIETVSNNKWLPIPCLKSEIVTSKWLEIGGVYSLTNDRQRVIPSLFTLRGNQRITRRWKVTGLKRGEFSLTDVTLVGGDLLGLGSVSHIIKMNAQVTILPKPLDINQAIMQSDSINGERMVKRFILEDPFYILGVREYTQRDPMNRIHWGMTARHHEMMVHNNAPTSRQNRLLILNMQSHSHQKVEVISEEKIEKGIKLCSALIEEAEKAGVEMGFATNTRLLQGEEEIRIHAALGSSHTYFIRQVLALLPLRMSKDFEEYLDDLHLDAEITEIIIVTCFLTTRIQQRLQYLMRQGIKVKLIVLAYAEPYSENEGLDIYYLGGEV